MPAPNADGGGARDGDQGPDRRQRLAGDPARSLVGCQRLVVCGGDGDCRRCLVRLPALGYVIAAAMVVNMVVAGLGGHRDS